MHQRQRKTCSPRPPPPVPTYCQEDIIYIHGSLGRRLHEEEGVLLGIGLRLLVLHHPFVGEVSLVASQRYHDVGGRLPLELLHPGLGPAECVLSRWAGSDAVWGRNW